MAGEEVDALYAQLQAIDFFPPKPKDGFEICYDTDDESEEDFSQEKKQKQKQMQMLKRKRKDLKLKIPLPSLPPPPPPPPPSPLLTEPGSPPVFVCETSLKKKKKKVETVVCETSLKKKKKKVETVVKPVPLVLQVGKLSKPRKPREKKEMSEVMVTEVKKEKMNEPTVEVVEWLCTFASVANLSCSQEAKECLRRRTCGKCLAVRLERLERASTLRERCWRNPRQTLRVLRKNFAL